MNLKICVEKSQICEKKFCKILFPNSNVIFLFPKMLFFNKFYNSKDFRGNITARKV